MGDRLLRVAEAAEALGLRPCTVRAWLLHRRIRYVKIGRAVRIPADAVEEIIAANTFPARTERQGKGRGATA